MIGHPIYDRNFVWQEKRTIHHKERRTHESERETEGKITSER